ncbi:cell division protein FtsQ/DivIB [Nocardioides panacisoli]|uniref:Cell division protein FtsQ n=1 Tax=Nocardioides panacisoli TaxID=627624 RepID=A0ABP7I8U2_9ACTN
MADRSAQARTRKRFARRQWARRWLTWRYIVVVVVVVLLIGFAVYSVYFSPWLQVQGVDVTGNSQVSDAEIIRTADVPEGGALAKVDLDAIAVRVRALPAVKSVDVSRKWPHDVRIDVVERTPVAVVARGDGYVDLDEEGVTFNRLAHPPAGLPLVETGAAAEPSALEEAAHVVAALPDDISSLVDHVQVDTVDEILLVLHDGRQVKWGSADQSDEKAQVLLALLDRKAQVYDVSVPGMPTTH